MIVDFVTRSLLWFQYKMSHIGYVFEHLVPSLGFYFRRLSLLGAQTLLEEVGQ